MQGFTFQGDRQTLQQFLLLCNRLNSFLVYQLGDPEWVGGLTRKIISLFVHVGSPRLLLTTHKLCRLLFVCDLSSGPKLGASMKDGCKRLVVDITKVIERKQTQKSPRVAKKNQKSPSLWNWNCIGQKTRLCVTCDRSTKSNARIPWLAAVPKAQNQKDIFFRLDRNRWQAIISHLESSA
jgi:hypothetical protein